MVIRNKQEEQMIYLVLIIIYMVLSFYIFSDIAGALGLLALWVGREFLPYMLGSCSSTLSYISYPLLVLALVFSVTLTTIPLTPATEKDKTQLILCAVIAYALISYIHSVVFPSLGNYFDNLVSELPAAFYLLTQLIFLFLLKRVWKRLDKNKRYLFLTLSIGGLIGIWFYLFLNTVMFEHMVVFVLIKFLKIITGL